MAGLTITPNPFAPHDGRIYHPVVEGMCVAEVVKKHIPDGLDVRVWVNGAEVTDRTRVLTAGDEAQVCAVIRGGGGGDGAKGILRTVALVVVAAAAVAITGGAAAGLFGAGFAAGTFGAGILGAAVMLGGSMLVNAILPPPKAEASDYSIEDSTTYGWGAPSNQLNEGLAVPVLYGTHKISPQVISRYRTTNGENEELNMLLLISDGHIDSITDVKANDVELESLDGATVSKRYGDLSQSVVPGFQDTIFEKIINSELAEEGSTLVVTTDGNAVEKIGVGLVFSSGLYTYSDGSYSSLEVKIKLEYRLAGTSAWNSFSGMETENGVSFFRISNDSSKAYRVYFQHSSTLAAGQYEVQATYVLKQDQGDSSVLRINRCYVEYLHELRTDDFTYPGTSLLGIQAVASDKIYGSTPVISCIATRDYVQQYPGTWGDGVPTQRDAHNPAWACYDMLIHPLYGMGLDPARIITSDFVSWASWCDGQNFTCNIYLDTTQSLYEALNIVSTLGRGSIVQRGTKFGVVWEQPSTRVHLFTPGNIIANSYSMNYLEYENRANVVEVTYFDSTLDYERKVLEVRTDDSEDLSTERKTAVTLYGCTNKDQAARHAKFLINSNKHLRRTITFNASIDAIPCEPGDVIGFAHDVPRYGEGGRIVSATSTTAVLSREVQFEDDKTYALIVRNSSNNALETVAIENPGESKTDTVTLSGSFSTTPEKGWVYSFGETDKEVKEFRILSITRSDELVVTIAALEYRPEIYDDNVDIPDYEQESNLPDLVGLAADDIYTIQPDGTVRATILATWRGFSDTWKYRCVSTSGNVIASGWTSLREVEIEGVEAGKCYDVIVEAPHGGTTLTVRQCMIIDPPEAPGNLTGSLLGEFVQLRWTVPASDMPISHYEIFKGATIDTGVFVGKADKTFTSFFELTGGEFTYWVRAVDMAGRKGAAASVTMTVKRSNDYQTLGELAFSDAATRSNVVLDGGQFLLPMSNQTWDEWWQEVYPAEHSTVTWQRWIDDGYTGLFAPASAVTGPVYIEETFDIGGIVTSAIIEIAYEVTTQQGDPSDLVVYPTVSYSEDGTSYQTVEGGFQVHANNFRFVKVRLDFEANGGLYGVTPSLKIVAKKLTDSGSEDIDDADLGTFVYTNENFVAINKVGITPKGDDGRMYAVDVPDGPSPLGFTVWLFDKDGNKVTGDFYWDVIGI